LSSTTSQRRSISFSSSASNSKGEPWSKENGRDVLLGNNKSRCGFVLTARLEGGAEFGEDPEMDVNNGM
jgi:hypothetical protein